MAHGRVPVHVLFLVRHTHTQHQGLPIARMIESGLPIRVEIEGDKRKHRAGHRGLLACVGLVFINHHSS